MRTQMTKENVVAFQKAFNSVDRNKSGHITPWDLRAYMRSIGKDPSDQDVQNMIEEGDQDGTGDLDFYEFLCLMDKIMIKQRLRKMFKQLDRRKSGYISAADLRRVMTELSKEEAEEMIKEADRDGDGQVSYKDFVKIMGPY